MISIPIRQMPSKVRRIALEFLIPICFLSCFLTQAAQAQECSKQEVINMNAGSVYNITIPSTGCSMAELQFANGANETLDAFSMSCQGSGSTSNFSLELNNKTPTGPLNMTIFCDRVSFCYTFSIQDPTSESTVDQQDRMQGICSPSEPPFPINKPGLPAAQAAASTGARAPMATQALNTALRASDISTDSFPSDSASGPRASAMSSVQTGPPASGASPSDPANHPDVSQASAMPNAQASSNPAEPSAIDAPSLSGSQNNPESSNQIAQASETSPPQTSVANSIEGPVSAQSSSATAIAQSTCLCPSVSAYA